MIIAALIGTATAQVARAGVVAHYPFETDGAHTWESVTGRQFDVSGAFGGEAVPGARGNALLLDGYTSYVGLNIDRLNSVNRQITVSLWVAVQSYPIIEHDVDDPHGQQAIVDCLDDANHTGFGFFIGNDGQYSFQLYVGDSKAIVNCGVILPRYRWNCLTAVANADEGWLRFYNNGDLVAESLFDRGRQIHVGAHTLHVGQNSWELWFAGFRTTAFGGLIDDLTIYDHCASVDEIRGWRPEHAPVFTAPPSRQNNRRWARFHPGFHGCPSYNWTNEPHGLFYSDGRWHLFFQKNAAGPYMSRLHWGHLTSTNLADWHEERIAITPNDPQNRAALDNDPYRRFGEDRKGCWSGCIGQDPALNDGKPTIFYTGVDFAKARIIQATPFGYDNSLLHWEKNLTPAIDGLPSNPPLAGDFRDPFLFRNGDYPCLIVGTARWHDDSQSALGACTLHYFKDGAWHNHPDDTFYRGWDKSADGEFIEMPSMMQMQNGRWLFCYTPLGTARGVQAVYRTGWLNPITPDGHGGQFLCDEQSPTTRPVDLFGSDGFGLLSPSLYKTADNRVIAIGIVPDIIGGDQQAANGFAHIYSLPREWHLDENNQLMQAPARELQQLRSSTEFHKYDFTYNGTMALGNVRGRSAEIRYRFRQGAQPTGIRFFKATGDPGYCAELEINPADQNVYIRTADFWTSGHDNRAHLEAEIGPNKEIDVALFIDHSIVDIFINDRFAASVRLWPQRDDATEIEVYTGCDTWVRNLDAWVLTPNTNRSSGGTILNNVDLTTRVGFLMGEENETSLNGQERAALTMFRSMYPNGRVIRPSEAQQLLITQYVGTVWVHIDRVGLPMGEMPGSFNNDVINALANYHRSGGNLYLSKQATQLVSRIGRISNEFAPNLYSNGDGAEGTDVWTVNARIGYYQIDSDPSQHYDHRSHPLYAGLMTSSAFPCETFCMLGTGDGTKMHREDHNCLWDLNALERHCTAPGKNTVEKFENQNNCTVIGTWGHVVDHAVAGIVEFKPNTSQQGASSRAASTSGTILANGLAAYELSPRQANNGYTSNLDLMTSNALAYLNERAPDSPLSGFDTEVMTPSRIYPAGLNVGYSGFEAGALVRVYSLDGRLLYQSALPDTDGTLPIGYSGLVIVKIADKVEKMLLK